MCILLGYSDVGYRVLINNKIIIARHVDIIERYVKYIGTDYKDNIDNDESKENDANTNDDLSDNFSESVDEYEEQQGKVTEKNNFFA